MTSRGDLSRAAGEVRAMKQKDKIVLDLESQWLKRPNTTDSYDCEVTTDKNASK